jgi:glutamine amidotransferase
MGNLCSLFNAVYEAGFDPVIVTPADSFDTLSHLFLPGVGGFATAMEEMGGANARVQAFIREGRPLMGVCLGMQLLAAAGTEGGNGSDPVAGLDCIPARVDRFADMPGRRLPHVGWNAVEFRRDHPLLDQVKTDRDFYFVHSYMMRCERDEDVLGTTTYGTPFTSVVARDNVAGLQFHPEKGQANGLRLIENFCHWDGAC